MSDLKREVFAKRWFVLISEQIESVLKWQGEDDIIEIMYSVEKIN